MSNNQPPRCPFCGFVPTHDQYELILHIETLHSEGQSPFVITADPAICPRDGCDEVLSQDEMISHLELHELQDSNIPVAEEGRRRGSSAAVHQPSTIPSARTSSKQSDKRNRQSGTIQAWKALFEGHRSRPSSENRHRTRHKSKKHVELPQDSGSSKLGAEAGGHTTSPNSSSTEDRSQQYSRLGKSELGRFAHETRMPDWLVSLLREQGQVVNDDIIPILAQLLGQNSSTQYAYICHPGTQHVSKLRREGGFCGYRNIQMLVSHIIKARSTGAERFGTTFPSIFQIQDLIENAWDMGFNAQGRIETGGVKGTRKYIGTPEAHAVFCSLGIPCSVAAFKDREQGKAKNLLLEAVERYFQSGIVNVEDRIHLTTLAPIYLQHPGHSLTIVGLEKQMDGRLNLLVFDPSFRDSGKIRRLVGTMFGQRPTAVGDTLQPYRRGSSYLRRYAEFEVLYLTNTIADQGRSHDNQFLSAAP